MDSPITPAAAPLVVGVTGHRDLLPEELPAIRERIHAFFLELNEQFPDLPVCVMNPLAEGADQLVAEVAIAMDIPVIAPLPMPRDLYVKDFQTQESLQVFESLYAYADVLELPLLDDVTPEDIRDYGPARNRQYAQMGVYICAHCHILLALWDGKPSADLGGTAQVVQFHHDDVMPGYTSATLQSRIMLADDESDLVYHVVCSRNRPEGAPATEFRPQETSWYTTDQSTPRTASLPGRYARLFEQTEEFNREAARYSGRIEEESYSLINEPAPADLPEGSRNINAMFVIADWLAIHYQKRFHLTLKLAHVLSILTGLAFLAYTDVENQSYMIYVFLVCFAAAVISLAIAQRLSWHRKYLDYRALAEGMRVQFYWSVAGISSGRDTKYTHDNFLQKQDQELGWIRNVMRVAGLVADVDPRSASAACIDYTVREWVDGQAGYYQKKTVERGKLDRWTGLTGRVCLSLGISAGIFLALSTGRLDELAQNGLIVLMGILPLIAAALDAYSNKMAAKELSNQYHFMGRVFTNAQVRLRAATGLEPRLEILKALGHASLDEHAEWILMHRQRPPELGGF